jgi:proteic killer suppression protein
MLKSILTQGRMRPAIGSGHLRQIRLLRISRSLAPGLCTSDALSGRTFAIPNALQREEGSHTEADPRAFGSAFGGIAVTPTHFNIPRKGDAVTPSTETAAFGGDSVFRSGAPRSTKMGTIRSPWRYDGARGSTLSLAGQRRRSTGALCLLLRNAQAPCKLTVDNSQPVAYAVNSMIRSFKSKPLAELWEKGRTSKIDAKMHERILRRLDRLDAAAMPQEMNIPGFDFHALRGFKPTRYSVHVNGPWCITFEFEDGDACRVAFEQYH